MLLCPASLQLVDLARASQTKNDGIVRCSSHLVEDKSPVVASDIDGTVTLYDSLPWLDRIMLLVRCIVGLCSSGRLRCDNLVALLHQRLDEALQSLDAVSDDILGFPTVWRYVSATTPVLGCTEVARRLLLMSDAVLARLLAIALLPIESIVVNRCSSLVPSMKHGLGWKYFLTRQGSHDRGIRLRR